MSTGKPFRLQSTGLRENSLHPIIDERYDFAVKSYRINEKSIRDVLSGAQRAAGHLKKSLTSQPTTSTRAYAALHRAYSQQVQDVINLKAIVHMAEDSCGWAEITKGCKGFLKSLPLTPYNLASTAEVLYSKYGTPEDDAASQTEDTDPKAELDDEATTVAPDSEEGPPIVVVGTTTQMQVDAVAAAIGSVMPDAEVMGIEVASGVALQPFGEEETLQGARTRAHNIQSEALPEAAIAIGIESGIKQVGSSYMEFTFVVALDQKTGAEGIAQSIGVAFPVEFVEEAMALGLDKVTVAQRVAEATGCDVDDPHSYLSQGMMPARKLIQDAIQMALVSLLQNAP